ncbi:kinase-like domain-containing protein [Glomus cerebriforme]|uniref:Kinase-like domain-containing protein n=1 Tax=Glomus cerebriforme TaxID=658196 RepID=A0A397S372_9GLOM|nr:kinase-like domain-containing protein [Glomus cerebriforme]RIA79169.1 kinase-like domain-containing protein [Glomus cerebriforme]
MIKTSIFRLTVSFRPLPRFQNSSKLLSYQILKFSTMASSTSKHELSGEEPSIQKRVKLSPHECDTCHKCLNEKFCKPCFERQYEKTQKDFSSGNESLDNLVKYVRYSEDGNISFLQWIPFDRLKDVNYLTKGGGGTTFTATWLDGRYLRWNHDEKRWLRTGETKVVIKTLKDSQTKLNDYAAELDAYFKCASQYHITYYGISQETTTNDYAIIMEYADPGDLHQFMRANKFKLYWRRKLELIRDVISGLEIIHDAGITHRYLHTGNVLKVKDVLINARINDLGLNLSNIASGEIQGNLPYMAPEILRGDSYTQASDIYSFAMILWEVSCGSQPFADRSHDVSLVLDINRGLRPTIPEAVSEEIPECYHTLVKQCWDDDPKKRPTASQIKEKIYEWLLVLGWFPTPDSRKHPEASQFETADDSKNKNDKSYNSAIYNQTVTAQTPVYTSQKFKRREISSEIAGGSTSINLFVPEEDNEDKGKSTTESH